MDSRGAVLRRPSLSRGRFLSLCLSRISAGDGRDSVAGTGCVQAADTISVRLPRNVQNAAGIENNSMMKEGKGHTDIHNIHRRGRPPAVPSTPHPAHHPSSAPTPNPAHNPPPSVSICVHQWPAKRNISLDTTLTSLIQYLQPLASSGGTPMPATSHPNSQFKPIAHAPSSFATSCPRGASSFRSSLCRLRVDHVLFVCWLCVGWWSVTCRLVVDWWSVTCRFLPATFGLNPCQSSLSSQNSPRNSITTTHTFLRGPELIPIFDPPYQPESHCLHLKISDGLNSTAASAPACPFHPTPGHRHTAPRSLPSTSTRHKFRPHTIPLFLLKIAAIRGRSFSQIQLCPRPPTPRPPTPRQPDERNERNS